MKIAKPGAGVAAAAVFVALPALTASADGSVDPSALQQSGPSATQRLDPGPASDVSGSCTLLLALDGIPYRVVEEARDRGAFDGWSPTSRLISTFPSTTHVAFASLFEPLGVAPSDGYELRYYDRERNRMIGGSPLHYQEQSYDWKHFLDVKRKSLFAKLLVYTTPRTTAKRELKKIRDAVLDSDRDLILAHVGSTDALAHLRGDDAMVKFMLRLDRALEQLQRDYRQRHDRPLHVVLYSDHGNTEGKVRSAKGIRRELRKAGFRVRKKLAGPDVVVAPTFGIVSYGPLFTEPGRAGDAAAAVVDVDAVDFAVWRSGDEEIEVLSAEGRARIRWRETDGRLRLAYDVITHDVLRIEDAVARLGRSGRLDPAGFADAEDWFRSTALGAYPAAVNRLVEAMTTDRVRSRATVLISMKPGYAWGWRTAHVMARLQGGRLEGTHGGLDRESSLGFWMTDNPALDVPFAWRADRALAAFARERARAGGARVAASAGSGH